MISRPLSDSSGGLLSIADIKVSAVIRGHEQQNSLPTCPLHTAHFSFTGLADSGCVVVYGDLVLENFLNNDFQVGQVLALHERTRSIHEFQHSTLNQRG